MWPKPVYPSCGYSLFLPLSPCGAPNKLDLCSILYNTEDKFRTTYWSRPKITALHHDIQTPPFRQCSSTLDMLPSVGTCFNSSLLPPSFFLLSLCLSSLQYFTFLLSLFHSDFWWHLCLLYFHWPSIGSPEFAPPKLDFPDKHISFI